ncbi:MAG: hypothetical protein J6I85_07015 [Clostridia bacterium]|nr:hypothetical protein [Clostridia bacterium]MBP3801750.1 hypothetical protein [Clostridia bacterium]
MFNKFKNNERVIVNGYGKNDGKLYKNVVGTVIWRDPFYLDYNIRFDDGTEDWLSPRALEKYEGEFEDEN